MRKEVTYAVVGGIILGLIVAFGVYRINSVVSGKNHINFATPTPQSAPPGELKIVLDKPENDDVVTNDLVTVTGLTKPLTWIVLSGENGDYFIQSDSSGTFSQDVELSPGVNQIKVTAFGASGKESATQVLVVYSSNFKERTLPTSSPSGNASETSDIRTKVAQDVANTLNHPKAYIGVVTDITDSTLEIKTTGSEIQQISVSANGITVTNSTGGTSKTVKTTDIAIGDFIVAMGYVDGNSVLDAQRILITTPITEAKIAVNIAKVTSTTQKALTVNVLPDGAEASIQPNANTNIENLTNSKSKSIKLGSIGAGDIIIYVTATDSKGGSIIRSIFQVASPQG